MAGLRATTARLAAYRRQWEQLGTFNNAADAAGGSADLTEQTGFGANPGQLRMLSYVPDGLPPRAPLVVVLHGCRQDSGYGGNAGWTALADKLGFAVLLPEQRSANNANTCFNWFLPEDTARDRGEAASIRQMIEKMVLDHDLDRARIFVTGLSAGGAMTSVMLATYPEVFAGGAIVAGLPYGVARNVQEALDAMFQGGSRPAADLGDKVRLASAHAGPWPRVSIWHGSADTTVRPGNAGEIEKQWCDVHGVGSRRPESAKVDGQVRRVWRNAAGEAVVESFTIAGMAHGTPIAAADGEDGGGTPAPFVLDAGIASTIHIAEFWGLTAAAPVRRQSSPASAKGGRAPEVIHLPSAPANSRASDAGPATPSAKAKAKPAQAASAAEKARAAKLKRFGIDPQAVIDKALKAAGLLKR